MHRFICVECLCCPISTWIFVGSILYYNWDVIHHWLSIHIVHLLLTGILAHARTHTQTNANKRIRSQRMNCAHILWCSRAVRVPIEMTHILKLIRMEQKSLLTIWKVSLFLLFCAFLTSSFSSSWSHFIVCSISNLVFVFIFAYGLLTCTHQLLLIANCSSVSDNLQIRVCFTFDSNRFCMLLMCLRMGQPNHRSATSLTLTTKQMNAMFVSTSKAISYWSHHTPLTLAT